MTSGLDRRDPISGNSKHTCCEEHSVAVFTWQLVGGRAVCGNSAKRGSWLLAIPDSVDG